ncbi:hypothetical protein [Hymenobacter sp. PAMC 26628]|uniref:hypothetical protein n=1 Tax=Hymenobacter sp. PAMC 26628 TaxID=1484118 RepID=UPI0007701CD7|nr:hypothetical protein [Hymenobacter sp. PAMC 26628]AMJ65876.1 hypothetical protein AXW84_10875 [Hymenobacter sp. PAMC 26628]
MNFEFAEQINNELEKFHFNEASRVAESELEIIPSTDFHTILEKSMNVQAKELAAWIEKFYKSTSKSINIKAMYFEMIEFDINTDIWSIDGFAFDKDGGLDLNDMEWLCDVTEETMTKSEFVLTGYEDLQNAFENITLDTDNLQNARDWCEQLIIVHFMELMQTTHLIAKQNNFAWANIPIYFTEHAYDFIVKSEN